MSEKWRINTRVVVISVNSATDYNLTNIEASTSSFQIVFKLNVTDDVERSSTLNSIFLLTAKRRQSLH